MSKTQCSKQESGPKTAMPQYMVRLWKEEDLIDCDSVIWVADWAKRFATNRLDNDVDNCVHRCVIGTYQLGYLYDYLKIEDKDARQSYFEEGIASALLHFIASYEMTGRNFDKILETKNWSTIMLKISTVPLIEYDVSDTENAINFIAESVYKYQRWMLYWDMGRKKRWDEKELMDSLFFITYRLMIVAYNEHCNIARGFQCCMQKLLDQEIKNH